MLEKEVEWWSLPSALTIYCYCLHRLIVSLKFVSTKRDNYRPVTRGDSRGSDEPPILTSFLLKPALCISTQQ